MLIPSMYLTNNNKIAVLNLLIISLAFIILYNSHNPSGQQAFGFHVETSNGISTQIQGMAESIDNSLNSTRAAIHNHNDAVALTELNTAQKQLSVLKNRNATFAMATEILQSVLSSSPSSSLSQVIQPTAPSSPSTFPTTPQPIAPQQQLPTSPTAPQVPSPGQQLQLPQQSSSSIQTPSPSPQPGQQTINPSSSLSRSSHLTPPLPAAPGTPPSSSIPATISPPPGAPPASSQVIPKTQSPTSSSPTSPPPPAR
jgi:hypothetical protein